MGRTKLESIELDDDNAITLSQFTNVVHRCTERLFPNDVILEMFEMASSQAKDLKVHENEFVKVLTHFGIYPPFPDVVKRKDFVKEVAENFHKKVEAVM